MGIQVSSANHSSRGRFRQAERMSDINIIPLVDVTLVLLVIFMVTAQVMEFGLDIQVPKVSQTVSSAEELPVISITKTGGLYLLDKPVQLVDLAGELQKRFPNQRAVYVRADAATVWQPIASVIAQMGAAKYEVRMVTRTGS
jgi:biopolymer transport protein ExbD